MAARPGPGKSERAVVDYLKGNPKPTDFIIQIKSTGEMTSRGSVVDCLEHHFDSVMMIKPHDHQYYLDEILHPSDSSKRALAKETIVMAESDKRKAAGLLRYFENTGEYEIFEIRRTKHAFLIQFILRYPDFLQLAQGATLPFAVKLSEEF